MNGGHAAQREEMAAEAPDHLFHLPALAADDAFSGGVDNQQVNAIETRQRLFHLGGGGGGQSELPVDQFIAGQSPNPASSAANSGQLLGEKGRSGETLGHAVAVAPGAKGEETGRFPQAVTADRLRFDAETAHQIADRRTQGYLADHQGVVILVYPFGQFLPPEVGWAELSGKM